MKKLWLFPSILFSGFVIWAASGLINMPDNVVLKDPRAGFLAPHAPDWIVPRRIDFYVEVKFWAEFIGKILSAFGGIGTAVVALVRIFKGKRG